MEFIVAGSGFDLLPNDIVATYSISNDDPLTGRYHMSTLYYCQLIYKSDNELIFESSDAAAHSALYLGAILSSDREAIYWLNESKPLP